MWDNTWQLIKELFLVTAWYIMGWLFNFVMRIIRFIAKLLVQIHNYRGEK